MQKKKKWFSLYVRARQKWITLTVILRQLPEKAQQSQKYNVIVKPLRKRIFLNQSAINLRPNESSWEQEGKKGKQQEGLLLFLANLVMNLLICSTCIQFLFPPYYAKRLISTHPLGGKNAQWAEYYQLETLQTKHRQISPKGPWQFWEYALVFWHGLSALTLDSKWYTQLTLKK